MSLQGQHSFPQRRTYGPGFVTEAWGFHPGLKGEVMEASPTDYEVEMRAKEMCFAICASGGFLDFEAGCCSVCPSVEMCQGWLSYSSDARAALRDQS